MVLKTKPIPKIFLSDRYQQWSKKTETVGRMILTVSSIICTVVGLLGILGFVTLNCLDLIPHDQKPQALYNSSEVLGLYSLVS
jgi:hypothetical protein